MKKLLVILFILSACSHQRPAQDAPMLVNVDATPAALDFLEISYQRGRNSYKFQVEKKSEIMFARSYVDQNLVQERKLQQKEFLELKQMADKIFAAEAASEAAPPESAGRKICRTPFEMETASGDKTKKIHGCRSSGAGPLVTELLHKADLMMLQGD